MAQKQHIVPEFYLKNFTDLNRPGKIWIYDKEIDQWRLGSPKSEAIQNEYYSFFNPEKGEIDRIAEHYLSSIETAAADIIRRVLAGERKYSAKDRINFAEFIATMHMRVTQTRQAIEDLLSSYYRKQLQDIFASPKRFEKAMANFREETGEDYYPNYEEIIDLLHSDQLIIETPKEHSLGAMLANSRELASIIALMRWMFLLSPSPQVFLTSDNPLVINNPTIQPDLRLGGFALPDTTFTFPISKDVCMVAAWVGNEIVERTSEYNVFTINIQTIKDANRFIYSSYRYNTLKDRTIADHQPK